MGIEGADAVGPQQADPVLSGNLEAASLERRAIRPRLAEACRDNDRRVDAARRARLDGLRCGLRRDDEDRQVDGVGNLGEIRVQQTLEKRSLFLADEVDRACVSALDEVARHAVAKLFWRGGCADDDNAARGEEGSEGIRH